jgi:DNA-binding IclR family transcriptional regulator
VAGRPSGSLAQAGNETVLVRALARGLGILRLFDHERPSWSLSEVARALCLNRGTAYRFLKTLEHEGFLTLDAADGKYHLGPALYPFAFGVSSLDEIRRTVAPPIDALVRQCQEAAVLTKWAHLGALTVYIALAERPFRPMTTEGDMIFDPRSSHSRVFLAFLDPEGRRRAFERLTPFWPPPRDADRYLAELAAVRRERVAYDVDEANPGVCSVASPVFGSSGRVEFSLAIVAPTERFGRAEAEAAARPLRQTADELSRLLGWRGA